MSDSLFVDNQTPAFEALTEGNAKQSKVLNLNGITAIRVAKPSGAAVRTSGGNRCKINQPVDVIISHGFVAIRPLNTTKDATPQASFEIDVEMEGGKPVINNYASTDAGATILTSPLASLGKTAPEVFGDIKNLGAATRAAGVSCSNNLTTLSPNDALQMLEAAQPGLLKKIKRSAAIAN